MLLVVLVPVACELCYRCVGCVRGSVQLVLRGKE